MADSETNVEAGNAAPKQAGFFGKTWRGDQPLWVNFWVLMVGGGLLFKMFWSSLGVAVMREGTPLSNLRLRMGADVWLLLTGPLFILSSLYLVIVMVGTWRSAGRYQGPKIWRWLAMLCVGYGLCQFALMWISFF
jgi:hypothetical protein